MAIIIQWNKFSIIGTILLIMGFCFFLPKLLTNFSSLIEVKGKVLNVETEYNWVESSKGTKSIKSGLVITLKNTKQTYEIFENIGDENFNPFFEEMKREIRLARKISIWIKKSDEYKLNPDVFQIKKANNRVIYSLNKSKELSKNGLIITTSFAFLLIFISITKYANQ